MTTPAPPGEPEHASDRVLLARAALAAALAEPGVVRGDAGRLGVFRTRDGASTLTGVTVAAEAGARYSVDLHVVARLVPLPALAGAVSDRVRRAAANAGLADALGAVSVAIEDVEDA